MFKKKYFRPWGTDSIAVVKRQFLDGTIVIAYEHESERSYTLSKSEAAKIGRFVRREDFRPTRAAAA